MSVTIYENRQYIIFPVSELSKVDFNEVSETSAQTVRKSINETKTFVKWDGATPSFVSSMSNVEGPYSHAEMLQILDTSEWNAPFTGSAP